MVGIKKPEVIAQLLKESENSDSKYIKQVAKKMDKLADDIIDLAFNKDIDISLIFRKEMKHLVIWMDELQKTAGFGKQENDEAVAADTQKAGIQTIQDAFVMYNRERMRDIIINDIKDCIKNWEEDFINKGSSLTDNWVKRIVVDVNIIGHLDGESNNIIKYNDLIEEICKEELGKNR
ncbi:MAG: hypothetical protein LBB81_03395 [Treponema sp.]|jgi:hypothetical protein|nr:hypothetical protein [Treponema sp.]